MSKYEHLKGYIGLDSGRRRFVSVDINEIKEAEASLGFPFPESLKEFYKDVGYGWLSEEGRSELRNLIIHPLDIVDLYKGESEFLPPDEEFIEGDLPIFDCGGYRFLVVRPESNDPERIYRDFGEEEAIAKDIEDLVMKLLNSPDFYEM